MKKCWWTKDIVVRQLRQVSHHSLSDSIIRHYNQALWGACCRHFGSVKKAVKSAKLVYVKKPNSTPWPIKVPSHNTDYAYFIGVLLGDGWLIRQYGSYVGVGCEGKDLDMIQKFGKIGEKLFGIKYRHLSRVRNKTGIIIHRAYFTSAAMSRFLREETNEKHDIPKWIIKGNKNIISHFISGFFDSDGTIAKTGGGRVKVPFCINIVQNKLKILQDVSKLMYILGVHSNIYKRDSGAKYVLVITSIGDSIKLSSIIKSRIHRKSERLKVLKTYKHVPRKYKGKHKIIATEAGKDE